MDGKHFDAWTRRRFGLAVGSALAALLALHHQDDAEAKKRCLRKGRACGTTRKRCCGKLECANTFVNDDWVDVCCKPDGESCTAESICCLTNCDVATGKCKTCQGQVCAGPDDCCPNYPDCDQGFCGGCAEFGHGCHAQRPCCSSNDECTNGYCGGCVRSFSEGNIQCFRGGVPCCDTECTFYSPDNDVGLCVSGQGGPCRVDIDCRTCSENYPENCDGACVAGECTV